MQDYLTTVPGLYAQNTQNFAQDLRISIRGFGARSGFGIRGIQLIVDGIPETTPDGQGQLDNLPLGLIQSLTVLRGPASSFYGNASGGVIQINTLEDFEDNFVRLRLQGGSFSSRNLAATIGLKNKKPRLFFIKTTLSQKDTAIIVNISNKFSTQGFGTISLKVLKSAGNSTIPIVPMLMMLEELI